jgi:hypothetical protein
VIDILKARHTALAGPVGAEVCVEMTVVFDAGQNSAANFAHLAQTGLRYVGSVPLSDVPDLLALPARRRQVVDAERWGGLTALQARREIYGTERRVVLTHSPTLAAMDETEKAPLTPDQEAVVRRLVAQASTYRPSTGLPACPRPCAVGHAWPARPVSCVVEHATVGYPVVGHRLARTRGSAHPGRLRRQHRRTGIRDRLPRLPPVQARLGGTAVHAVGLPTAWHILGGHERDAVAFWDHRWRGRARWLPAA